ncbi:unnamed protein product [Haemonchus placei]|uniref:Serine/threonine-protein phosphatase n=1 Tax=Haemonchus placei TaxID=6290 RepID=A0A0N4WC97_HAEPC|nr:unnamed protein product [Haemonchus placei]
MKVAHKSVSGISTGIMRKSNPKEFDNNVKVHSLVTEFKAYKPPAGIVAPPLLILGDVHGQLYDMLDILTFVSKRIYFTKLPELLKIGHPPQKRLLFLGDYVDRGDYSLETITLLLAFKLRFPKEIYLLRGNHETRCVNRQYGFFDECKRKFPEKGVELWTLFQHVFNCLPMAALVGTKIFCAHGGISEDLISFKQFESYVEIIRAFY